ncbi:bactericidal permeability-increasing protein-like [Mytilus trossulus]|uniref:bactericidal permeability-increasing protein-like n=1 Tax=Mytilus trossulus TaxID=6551 RepID=UPI0030055E31
MQCKITVSLICLFLVIISSVCSKRITSQQINKAVGILEEISGRDLSRHLKIKDVDLKGGSYIKNIKITHVEIPEIKIKGNWKRTIVVEAYNIGLGLTADWRVKKRFFWGLIPYQESGTLKGSVSKVQFEVTLNMRTFEVANCDDSIGSIKVQLRGKLLAWVVRTFVNIEKRLKRKLDGKICEAVSKAINEQSSRISRIMQGRYKNFF